MSALSTPVAWLRSHWIPAAEVRAEIWALGGRHGGRVMEGARLEAKGPGLSPHRAMLLQAVLRTHAGSDAARAERNSTASDGGLG